MYTKRGGAETAAEGEKYIDKKTLWWSRAHEKRDTL